MQVTKKNLSDTKVQLTLVADAAQLAAAKQQSLEHLARDMRLPGFRQGKAPLALVEKQANPQAFQTEFLDRAMNDLYTAAIGEEKLRPVSQPEVKINKFVPFDTLEIELEVEIIGDIKLPDYKKIKLEKKSSKVSAKEVDEVLDQLTKREAEKKDVDRAAKDGDQATIDFKGVDAKTKEPIKGADGKDYPLQLGSKTFIPGFEENLIGMKSGEEKEFTITFPKDYGVKTLQNRKVTFTVTVKSVQEIIAPQVNDDFAAKVGPFKTVDELKDDVKKQLQTEKDHQSDREYTDQLLGKIAEQAQVAIPATLIDEQMERIEREQRQNLMYRGLTWPEYLESEGFADDEAFRAKHRPDAELRVKAGLVLAEIAEKEEIQLTTDELNVRMQMLRAQYPDPQMQAELEKPEARRDIASRMMTEKTIDRLVSYASGEVTKVQAAKTEALDKPKAKTSKKK